MANYPRQPLSKKPFPRFSHDFYEMQLFGDDHFVAAVPLEANPELKRKLFGAIKSDLLGIKSVDHMIRRYGRSWVFPGPQRRQSFVIHTLRAIDAKVHALCDAVAAGRPRPNHYGLLSGEMALMRLQPTFRSALILVSQAYAFESSAIIRLGLEQIAWAYGVRNYTSKEQVSSLRPTKAIDFLKTFEPRAGRLYAALTERAHLNTTLADTYYTEEADGVVIIKHQLSDESYIALGHLILALELFEKVVLNLLGSYIDYPPSSGFLNPSRTGRPGLEKALRTLAARHRSLRTLLSARG